MNDTALSLYLSHRAEQEVREWLDEVGIGFTDSVAEVPSVSTETAVGVTRNGEWKQGIQRSSDKRI